MVLVLELLAAHAGEPLTFSEIVRRVQLSKATCHAVLLSLVDAGYVVRHEKQKTYVLGPAMVGIGRAAEQSYPFVPAVRHLVTDLLEQAGRSCAITAVTGDSIVVLDHEGTEGLNYLRRGNRVPFVSPYGIVHAAWAPEAVRRRWLRRDPARSPGRAAEMTKLIADVRSRGFSVSPLDDERKHLRELLALVKQDILSDDLRRLLEPTSGTISRDYLWDEIRDRKHVSVSAISAPVFDRDGRVTFGVHLQVLEQRITMSMLSRYASAIARTAALATALIDEASAGAGRRAVPQD